MIFFITFTVDTCTTLYPLLRRSPVIDLPALSSGVCRGDEERAEGGWKLAADDRGEGWRKGESARPSLARAGAVEQALAGRPQGSRVALAAPW